MTTADADTSIPKELRLYSSGGWLMGVGAGTTACLWSVNFAEPIPHPVFSVTVTVTVLAFLTGLVFTVISTAARWVVKELGNKQDAVVEQVTAIAAQVLSNGDVANQLMAARTVDFHNLEDRLEGVVRPLTFDAIEDLKKSSASRYEALADQLAVLAGKVERVQERHLAEVQEAYEVGRLTGHNGQQPS